MTSPLRIANASGFYGDRFSAVHEMLTGGEIDVLTGDYLAELTMLILAMDRLRDPELGYAKTFLGQMEAELGLVADTGVKIVVNAGGLNPAGLADKLRDTAARLGVDVSVAHVEGDDLLERAADLGLDGPLAVNAYLGAGGGSPRPSGRVRRSSSPGGSPTRRWLSGPPSITSVGPGTTATRSPVPSPPATSSSAARRPPVGTSRSSPRSET